MSVIILFISIRVSHYQNHLQNACACLSFKSFSYYSITALSYRRESTKKIEENLQKQLLNETIKLWSVYVWRLINNRFFPSSSTSFATVWMECGKRKKIYSMRNAFWYANNSHERFKLYENIIAHDGILSIHRWAKCKDKKKRKNKPEQCYSHEAKRNSIILKAKSLPEESSRKKKCFR